MKKIILAFLILSSVAFAETGIVTQCVANDTLLSTLTLLRCVNANCNTIVTNATQFCQYGCIDAEVPNHCAPAPTQVNLMFLIIIILVMFVLAGGYMYFKGH